MNDAKTTGKPLTAHEVLKINQQITKIDRIWQDANLNFTGGGGSLLVRVTGFAIGLLSYVFKV